MLVIFLLTMIVVTYLIFTFTPFAKMDEQNSNNAPIPVVAILPIELNSEEPELEILSFAISDFLGNKLSSVLGMSVIYPNTIKALDKTELDVWAVEEHTHADYIVQGSMRYSPTQNTVSLNVTLHAGYLKETLVPHALGEFDISLPTDTSGLINMYNDRQILVKEILQMIKPGVQLDAENHVGTQDPDAYRLVIAAHKHD